MNAAQPNNEVYEAAGHGDVPALLKALASHGHLIDIPDPLTLRTPLHQASERGHEAVIEALIQAGSKAIDALDKEKHTPLHLAAKSGRVPAIEVLIRLGCAIDPLTTNGWSPLFLAAQRGHALAIEALIRLGSQTIDTPSRNNSATPMHYAAFYGHVQTIETLIRHGSRVIDSADIYGRTPMHAAVRAKQVGAVATLIRLGSQSLDLVNARGESPLFVSVFNSFAECTMLLRACGASANFSTDGLPKEGIELLTQAMTEDEIAELRFQVYFSHSLVAQLLLALPG